MSPMNNRLLVPRKTPGLLDLVPGAAAAYSLRSLSNSYAGPVVTVRRSSDDAEEDFTAAEVSDGTLAAFCGAGDGFVKQWWDQSGNARHASQTTAGYQPKIVSSGVVVTEEGKPAILLDGTDDFLLTANSALPRFENLGGFVVVTLGGAGLQRIVSRRSDITGDGWQTRELGTNVSLFVDTTTTDSATGGATTAAQTLMYFGFDGTNIIVRLNGYVYAQTTHANPGVISAVTIPIYIGRAPSGGQLFTGKMQEIVLYESAVTSQIELAEGNIAWGYSV